MDFLSKKCTFHQFTQDILDASDSFDCDHADLNDFFINDCVNYSNQLLGKSYCFTLDADPKKIVCAFTVSNDSIKASDLPGSRKKKVIKTIPRPKHMRNYPAVLIGRLGVSKDFKKNGIGKELMDFIKSWFIDDANKTGCRFIVVDSYNEIVPLRYYIKNSFIEMFSSESQEKAYFDLDEDDELKTRLLYYDLIVLSS